MIHNEREYKISKASLAKLEAAISDRDQNEFPEWLKKAHNDAVNSQITEIREDIEEYENLKAGRGFVWECSDLRELPDYLIKARIARGFTQKDLADILNLKSQQIQRYESTKYKGANLSRLLDVAAAVGLTVTSIVESLTAYSEESTNETKKVNLDWELFPFKQMIERGWIDVKENAREYIEFYTGEHLSAAMHRKKIYGRNKPDIYSIVAWEARVLQKAKDVIESCEINEFHLDDSWLNELVEISKHDNSPLAAKQYLEEKGILLIIESHLDKTYLDGAAMITDTGTPIIALTLRHDRLDNFWFVLMHELGHIFRHIMHGVNMQFFDEDDGVKVDGFERDADEFATQNLIPDEAWDLCISRFTMTRDAVMSDSQRLNISPAIIAGRIRRETGNYYLLTDLVGSGQVRESLKEEYL